MSEKPVAPAALRAVDPREARFREELVTTLWLQQQVRAGRALPVSEAYAVAHALHVSLQQEGQDRMPQLPLRTPSDYLAVHAINVALLAIALADFVGLGTAETREVGLAALLHDIGMTRMPLELLTKADTLTPPEVAVIRQHPSIGAAILFDADVPLDLCAVVAYEHHIGYDGSGYPALTYPRATHYVTRLVQLCDLYHALRTPRPFRAAWPTDLAIAFIHEHAGFEHDPELATAFTQMLAKRGVGQRT